MTVSMEVSDDAGQTYNLTVTMLTGDIGLNTTSETNKHIVWDFGAEHPEYFSDQIKIKIIADNGLVGFGEMGGGRESAENTFRSLKSYLVGHDPLQLEQLRWKIMNPVASLFKPINGTKQISIQLSITKPCL